MEFSKLLDESVKIDIWICLQRFVINEFFNSCFMDLSKLLRGFFKDVLCISHPLPNKTKLKLDQDFKAGWSFCFKLNELNEWKFSMPWVGLASGNAFKNCHSYQSLWSWYSVIEVWWSHDRVELILCWCTTDNFPESEIRSLPFFARFCLPLVPHSTRLSSHPRPRPPPAPKSSPWSQIRSLANALQP